MYLCNRTITTALGALALSAALALGPARAEDSPDPIKLTLHDWTGQLITTHIMGEVLKKAGNNVQYVQADYLAQFAGLETGDLDVAMEMWETTGREAMDAGIATGKVENFGPTGMKAKDDYIDLDNESTDEEFDPDEESNCRYGNPDPEESAVSCVAHIA